MDSINFVVRAINHRFNVGLLESLTIIETEAPCLLIQNLINGYTVSGELYIRSQVRNDDFTSFQVFCQI